MEIITPKSEIIMHVKQMLNRKSSKFATISLFCQSLPDVFNFLGCNCRSAYSPEPLLPYLDLHQVRNHFHFFFPLPSLHLSISLVTMETAHPVRDPSHQKSTTQSRRFCQLFLDRPLTGMCGQHMLRHGVLVEARPRMECAGAKCR